MKKYLSISFLASLFVLTTFLTGCKTHSTFLYLQDLKENVSYKTRPIPELTMEPGDRLTISISYKIAELTIPFKKNASFNVASEKGNIGASTTSSADNSYLVDKDGNIEFPVFGKVHVEGLTTNQISDKIKQKIVEGKYIPDPIVTTNLINAKVYLLGAIENQGIMSINDGHLNMLQLISRARNLRPNARYNYIKVIREENGVRKMYVMNIRTKDIYNSPAFYLKQNDMVYVEPRYRLASPINNFYKYTSLFFTISSLASSVLFYLKK